MARYDSLNRTTGAVYLAGYSVECIIKSLILSAVPFSREEAILANFRGRQAHNFYWLMGLYRQYRGIALPPHLTGYFEQVADWSTDMRYSPATIQTSNAKDFLHATTMIIKWADGRL